MNKASYANAKPFVGIFSSADASALSEANSRFTVTEAASTQALVLGSTQTLVVTDIDVVAAAALTVTIYDGADTAAGTGETLLKGGFAANGGISSHLMTGHVCQTGSYPKVKTSGAGQIDVVIRGHIIPYQ